MNDAHNRFSLKAVVTMKAYCTSQRSEHFIFNKYLKSSEFKPFHYLLSRQKQKSFVLKE